MSAHVWDARVEVWRDPREAALQVFVRDRRTQRVLAPVALEWVDQEMAAYQRPFLSLDDDLGDVFADAFAEFAYGREMPGAMHKLREDYEAERERVDKFIAHALRVLER